jgi:hypothetical protein
MTDIWPSWVSALLTFWVSFRWLPALSAASCDRRTRSLHPGPAAHPGQSSYLSASLTAVGPPLRHAQWSAQSVWLELAGESPAAGAPTDDGRCGHDWVSTRARFHALFRKGLPKGPAWGRFVENLEGVATSLRAFPPGVFPLGKDKRILPAWA